MKRITKIAIGVGTALTLDWLRRSVRNLTVMDRIGMGQGPDMAPATVRCRHGPGMGTWVEWRRCTTAWAAAHGNPSAMADARIAYLKSELKITPRRNRHGRSSPIRRNNAQTPCRRCAPAHKAASRRRRRTARSA